MGKLIFFRRDAEYIFCPVGVFTVVLWRHLSAWLHFSRSVDAAFGFLFSRANRHYTFAFRFENTWIQRRQMMRRFPRPLGMAFCCCCPICRILISKLIVVRVSSFFSFSLFISRCHTYTAITVLMPGRWRWNDCSSVWPRAEYNILWRIFGWWPHEYWLRIHDRWCRLRYFIWPIFRKILIIICKCKGFYHQRNRFASVKSCFSLNCGEVASCPSRVFSRTWLNHGATRIVALNAMNNSFTSVCWVGHFLRWTTKCAFTVDHRRIQRDREGFRKRTRYENET